MLGRVDKKREEIGQLQTASKYGACTCGGHWLLNQSHAILGDSSGANKEIFAYLLQHTYSTSPRLVSCPQQVFLNLLMKAGHILIQQWHRVRETATSIL